MLFAMTMAAMLAGGDVAGLTQALPGAAAEAGTCDPASDVVLDNARGVRIRRTCLAADGKTEAFVEVISGHSGQTLGKLTRSMIAAAAARPNLEAEHLMRRDALLDSDAKRMTVISGENAVVVIQCRDENFMRTIAQNVNYNLVERSSLIR